MTETIDNEIDLKYKKVVSVINSAGGTPLPVTNTLVDILKHIINENELDFVLAFKKNKSQTLEQLKQSSKLKKEEIVKRIEILAKKGVMFNQPNRQGVMVYRLLPFINVGIFEYTFMKELEYTEENKDLATLFYRMQQELRNFVQANYDNVVPFMLKQLPIDRTVPILLNKVTGKEIEIIVNQDLDVPIEKVLPAQSVEELINKFDDIAVGHCFCRHHKDLLGEPCKQTEKRENCFTFGKSARHVSENGFGRLITKEEALTILKEAKEDGLVHKAYHPNFDVSKDETSICNCCACCCGQSPKNLIGVTINSTNFIAKFNEDICKGCGTCVEKCHTTAIELNENNKAELTGEFCIGCGVCAYFCPENAISMIEGKRVVKIPPPRQR